MQQPHFTDENVEAREVTWLPRGVSPAQAGLEFSASPSLGSPSCFAARQPLVRGGAPYQERQADRQMGALRMCWRQWMWMKQLRAVDGAKVAQLSLGQQEGGEQVSD